jgi:hypothetical protein
MPDPTTTNPSSLPNLARRLDNMSGVLGVALAQWAIRDETKAQPEIRQAANTAVAAIDDMLAALHRARQQLVTEIRAADDANAARVDAMLAEARSDEAGK